jgi:hypothetical protein
MHRFQKISPGVGLAVLASAAAAIVIASCKPGTICDKPDYEELCANPQLGGTSGSVDSGGGGSGGRGGTGGGGSGGTGGGGSTGTVGPDTPVANCAQYNTLGKMDTFFAMRCGQDGLCHTGGGANAWSDLKTAPVFMRMLNTAPKFVCKTQKMIDPADWQKSVILLKTQQEMPKCADGTAAGATTMPPPESAQAGVAMKQAPLSAAEKTCIENFLRAATGAQ